MSDANEKALKVFDASFRYIRERDGLQLKL